MRVEKPLQVADGDADTELMTRLGGSRPVPRPALAVATASSRIVICAGVVGALGAPVVAGALGAAALAAVLSARGQQPAEPRLLAPLPMGMPSNRAEIVAPRAGDLAATRPDAHTDAA